MGWYFAACQLLDHAWPVFMLLGLEKAGHNHSIPTFNGLDLIEVPYTHSLGMSVVWSFLFAGVVRFATGSSRGALVSGLAVFSHWIFDWITHIPDLQLWFGTEKYGLGLWRSAPATFIVEGAMFVVSIFLYLKSRAIPSRAQTISFWIMIAFMAIIYTGHVFGPKPPETLAPELVAGPAFALWLFVLWAYFVDRTRNASASVPGQKQPR
ncbi:MAG: hypothetical protein ABL958_18175 [Bdellovibrionia bacterium]